MLVLDSEANDGPKPDPGARWCAVNNSAEQIDRTRSKQRLINIGRIKIADREKKQTSDHPGADEVIAQTRPPSSRASMPARATVTALASAGKIRSANNELPNKISSIRTRMHSAVPDRRNRNRDG